MNWFIVIFLASGGLSVGRDDDHHAFRFASQVQCEAYLITTAQPGYVLFAACVRGRSPQDWTH